MTSINYNPDVLLCLANLSNDEVFTPPELANSILDLLPKDIWKNKDAKFLDPVSKSGVFLREITKRLIVGLEDEIPDLQTRVNHILKNQVFGIAITELTSLLSKRTLYCAKSANSDKSICNEFKNEDGNIRYKNINHTFKSGKCEFCGANEDVYSRDDDMETHAYEFIHTNNPKEIFNMKFDVIVGNPPYQLNVGNTTGNSSKAKSIYHMFIEQAKKLNPRYLTMIVPSRWMTRSVEGIPDKWIDDMLNENKISVIYDFLNSQDCFPGVQIEGGVNYFLWDRDYKKECRYILNINKDTIYERVDFLNSNKTDIIIRDPFAINIIKKVNILNPNYIKNSEQNFSSIVSPKDFFTNKTLLTSSWKDYKKEEDMEYNIKYFLNKNIHKVEYGWISLNNIPKNIEVVNINKVYIPAANGSSEIVLGKPFVGTKGSACSQTYLIIGYNKNYSIDECKNIVSYVKTKFFRFLVSIKKKTQNGARGVYQFVPMQDFKETWTDEKLYKKYGLSQEEIDFIESMIRPMDSSDE